MSEKHWTEDQKKVIAIDGQDILVSAAAGSGKTATMVQRIIEKVKKGTSIEKFLVVTFTRSAAAEMKERIGNALYEALEEEKNPGFLEDQIQLVNSAQITTIDSFCQYVVKNYFYTVDLDPEFRVADDDEIKLVFSTALRDFLDEEVEGALEESGDKSFIKVMDVAAGWKNSDAMENMIKRLYDQAQSKPYPEEWLEDTLRVYEEASHVETFRDSSFYGDILSHISRILERACECEKKALDIACSDDELEEIYGGFLQREIDQLEEIKKLVAEKNLDEAAASVPLMTYDRLPPKKKKELEEKGLLERKDALKALRDMSKEMIRDLENMLCVKKNGGTSVSEKAAEQFAAVKPFAETAVKITLKFMKRFEAAKKEKGIIDFSDMEHIALRILTRRDPETGEYVPSDAAVSLRKRFDEIMVDEYQDSNFVQEAILSAIAGPENARPDMFMVGDVKQSIYGFRSARPDLFIGKYERFFNVKNLSIEEADRFADEHKNALIVLKENFRSRRSVLDITNDLFSRIMHKDTGDVEYDDDARLVCGSPLYSGETDEHDYVPELILVENEEREETGEHEVSLLPSEVEAQAAANKINEMVNGRTPLYIKDGDKTRKLKYSDIAIITRSLRSVGSQYLNVLRSNGIPAFSSTETGYFSANEIVVTLNYLRILDNPLQDIPLASVLRSRYGNFTDEDLAELKILWEKGGKPALFDALCKAAAAHENGSEEEKTAPEYEHSEKEDENSEGQGNSEKGEAVARKAADFMKFYKKFYADSKILSVYDLLNEIYEDTGFRDIALATRDGEKCRADLDLLLQKAYEFSNTGGRSIFSFVHFIEELNEEDIDYGEGKLINENADAVSIMTIHKSKGLEFPVVILTQLGKKFSSRDYSGRVIIDPDKGICSDLVFPEKNMTSGWIYKKYLSDLIKKRQCSEEMRLLYVAMTRAREKLIFIEGVKPEEGSGKSTPGEKIREKGYCAEISIDNGIPDADTCTSFGSWIIPLFCMEGKNGTRALSDCAAAFAEKLSGGDEELSAVSDSGSQRVSIISYKSCLRAAASYMAETDTETLSNSAFSPDSRGDADGGMDADGKDRNPEFKNNESESPEFKSPEFKSTDDAVVKLFHLQKNFTYDFADDEEIPDKVSVSELKDAAPDTEKLFDDEESVPFYGNNLYGEDLYEEDLYGENLKIQEDSEKEKSNPSPSRASGIKKYKKGTFTGSERGTAYHSVMEHFPFEARKEYTDNPEKIRNFIDSLAGSFISKAQAEAVNENDIAEFLKSELSARMEMAAEKDMLFREQPFMKKYPSYLLFNVKNREHITIVQGTIDAFFENEDGTYTVADYKTDSIRGCTEKEFEKKLEERYRKQLLFYADAVESLTGRKVKGKIIYSFALGREIKLQDGERSE